MFSLNTPVKYHLSNSPLVQVIAQVRFPLIARLQTLSGVVDLQENLRPVFPFMERREVATLAMTIGGVAASPLEQEPSTSWLFTNESGWELAVDAGSATLTAKSNYQGFDDLYELLESVITALADEGLRRCDRLGLRFINVAELDVNDLHRAATRIAQSCSVGREAEFSTTKQCLKARLRRLAFNLRALSTLQLLMRSCITGMFQRTLHLGRCWKVAVTLLLFFSISISSSRNLSCSIGTRCWVNL